MDTPNGKSGELVYIFSKARIPSTSLRFNYTSFKCLQVSTLVYLTKSHNANIMHMYMHHSWLKTTPFTLNIVS